MKPVTKEALGDAVRHFSFEGSPVKTSVNESGHINDTIELLFKDEGGAEHHYILQRINTEVFKNPDELMENVLNVTQFLKKKIIKAGGDPKRETLSVVPAAGGAPLYKDAFGNAFRAYIFIEDAVCYDVPKTPKIFYQSAVAFGHFQSMLSDYPAETLHETIPDFHNTAKRLRDFKEAVNRDTAKRLAGVKEEAGFLLLRDHYAHAFENLTEEGKVPLRVTHNDAKLSNVMFDKKTGKALCVIDLDTIMPGLSMIDFGDAIRFGASTAAEDERDLTKVHFDKEKYDAYREGFLQGCGGALTKKEVELLPMGAKVITYEQALRFLGDYLDGDVYYRTDRKEQNLDRARTQIRLLEEMEEKL